MRNPFFALIQKNAISPAMNAQELAQLQGPEIQAWIAAHRHATPFQLAMMRHAPDFPAALVIGQVALLQKAAVKLPAWSSHQCIIPQRAYEQSTSQAMAEAKPLGQGLSALDLSCGLGADDRALAMHYASVIALEPDPLLFDVLLHNMAAMGIDNVALHCQRAEEFLANFAGPMFDLIYVDPDRRDDKGKRQFGLRDCQPDVLALLPDLLRLGRRILIKASPMLDITAVMAEFDFPLMIWVLAEGNECKELLIDIQPAQVAAQRGAIFIRKGRAYSYVAGPSQSIATWPIDRMPAYIYEVDSALYKAGIAQDWLADYFGANAGMVGLTGYCYADEDRPDFHGHRFKVLAQLEFKPAEIRKFCKAKGIAKLQYSRRDFDIPLEQVRQQIKLPEGGQYYLLLTRWGGQGRTAFLAERLDK
jgi:hypothetical protein